MIMKGQKINDRYQIMRTIGEGGMANVYLAYDTILNREVAVKILRGDLAGDEKFVRKFQREAISASSLNHPNIVEMYDVGEDDGQYFIVMEYVEGKTLKSLIKKRGALTLPEVIDIMLQLSDGIACAHESFIIHRDIKPQNVMILEDGRVKITDFGIAMALNSNELTQTNSVMGSVHYLPPEQANGSGSTVQSDIYSLGILMYELLTGKVPFKGENAVEIAIKQMKEPIPSIRDFNPDIPQSIENIILKATAKNPKNRYENINQMREDIETCLTSARRDEPPYVYPYPDLEVEESKQVVKSKPEKRKKDKKEKRLNIVLIVAISICVGLVLVLGIGILVIPKLTEVPEIRIPDVADYTIVRAEDALKELGFEVATEVEEEASNKIEKGKVIRTNPQVDRKVKKGTVITLIVSSGPKGIQLENYVGKNYLEVKGILEDKKIYVLTEKKEVSDKDQQKENIIIEQKPAAGQLVEEGDTVTLVIPDIVTEFPDFVKEGWSKSDIETFCEKYSLTLIPEYKETNDVAEGTVLAQSRTAGSRVMANTSLKITFAIKKEEVPTDPSEEDTGSE